MIAFNAIVPYIGHKLGLTAQGVIWLECVACGYTQDLTDGYVDAEEEAQRELTEKESKSLGQKK